MADTVQFYTNSTSCSGAPSSNTDTPINKCALLFSGALSVEVSEFPSCDRGASPQLQVHDADECQGEPWTTITVVGKCLNTDAGQGHVASAGMFICVDSSGATVTAAASSSPSNIASSSAPSTTLSTPSASTVSSKLSEDSKIGIGIGVPCVVLAALTLVFAYFWRQRRRDRVR